MIGNFRKIKWVKDPLKFGVTQMLSGNASLCALTIPYNNARLLQLAGVVPKGTATNVTVIVKVGDNGPIALKIALIDMVSLKFLE